MLKNSDWKFSFDFLALGILSIAFMKWMSLRRDPERGKKQIPFFYFLSPIYALPTWEKSRKKVPGDLKKLSTRLVPILFTTVLLLSIYYPLITKLKLPLLLESYLAIFPLYSLTELVGVIIQILFLSTGWLLPPTHQSPLRSQNLSDFWGRHWNPWMANWLKQ